MCGMVSFVAAGFSIALIITEGTNPWESYGDGTPPSYNSSETDESMAK